MNAVGVALVWCIVQVTLVGVLAAVLYLVSRRLRPAAAAPLVLASLAAVIAISLMTFSPWPRWSFSPLPKGEGTAASSPRLLAEEGPGVRASAAGATAGSSSSAGDGNFAQTPDGPHPNPLPKGEGTTDSSPRPLAGEGPGVRASGIQSALQLLLRNITEEINRPLDVATANAWGWPAVVAVVILAAMLCGLGWLLLGLAAIVAQRQRSRPLQDRRLLELVDVLRAELGCRRSIEVRQADNLATAATIGSLRPVLLLPPDWQDWTTEQRRAVLAHEIAHVRGRDFPALLFGQLALVLHFYHPLLHWLVARLRLEQELAADAAAAGISGGQREYLMTIAELALHRADRPLGPPARMFLPTRTTFLRRIAMLRDSKLRLERLSLPARLSAVGVVLLCGLLAAGFRGPSGPTPALAEDVAKSVDMADTDVIDATFLTDDAAAILVVRPAAIFAQPEMAAVKKAFEDMRVNLPPLARFNELDLRQFTIIVPKNELSTGLREIRISQLDKPFGDEIFSGFTEAKPDDLIFVGKRLYVANGGRSYILRIDDRTMIQTSSLELLKQYLSSRRGVPAWLPAEVWQACRKDQYFMALDSSFARSEIRQLKRQLFPPMLQAAIGSVVPLWNDTSALAAGARLEGKLTAHAWAAGNDAAAAERVQRTAEALKILAQSAVKNTHATMESVERPDRQAVLAMLDAADTLLENAKLSRDGPLVSLETSAMIGQAQIDSLVASIGAARQNTRQMQAMNQLKMIALAMHNYAQANNRFPPAVLYGPDGKTPYSWRVALLPYLDAQDLHWEYRFDEPWDGPNNRKLIDRMPAVFRSPTQPADSHNSAYYVLTGPGTMFDGKEGTSFKQITDGTSNTILLVEAKRDTPWTKPEDIEYDAEKPIPQLGGFLMGGFNVALADGSQHFLSNSIDTGVLRCLITKADGKPIRPEQFLPPPPQQPRQLDNRMGGKHTVSAFLRIAAEPDSDRNNFEISKKTQRQILLCEYVLQRALKNPNVANIPSFQLMVALGNADRSLASQLQVSFPGNAQIMQVSFSGNNPKEAAVLVNAVVDVYLDVVNERERAGKKLRLIELERTYSARKKTLENTPEKIATDETLQKMAQERDKLKAELDKPPRVTLLQKAVWPPIIDPSVPVEAAPPR